MKTLIFEGNIKKVATTLVLSKFSKKAFNLSCSPISYKVYEDKPLPKDNWIKVRNIQIINFRGKETSKNNKGD